MSKVVTDDALIDEAISRSVADVLPSKQAFKELLKSGKRLTFYVGIDPTADYVHLGHSTNYLLLERFHQLGHRIIVLVGDFTAMIGDPSDKTSMRVQLTREQVLENLKTFKNQIGKILNFDENAENPIEFKFNSEWLSKLNFQDTVELASNFTVQQMIERDAFQKRLSDNKPLFVHEFFYPLMQGYDSVAMDVDVEVGGTDQTFNMLAGRTLLKRYKSKDKFVIATTLLENPETGEKLMSKSLGTGVGLDEPPRQMFAKTMQLADAGILQCFKDCTRLSLADIAKIKEELESGTNPRDVKLRLAHEVVNMYHGIEAADDAQAYWVSAVSDKVVQADAPIAEINPTEDLAAEITRIGAAPSNGQARRLFGEGAIRINGEKVEYGKAPELKDGDILAVGKKQTFKIKLV